MVPRAATPTSAAIGLMHSKVVRLTDGKED